jgi:hypothetical protein
MVVVFTVNATRRRKLGKYLFFDRLSVCQTTAAVVLGWYAKCVLDTIVKVVRFREIQKKIKISTELTKKPKDLAFKLNVSERTIYNYIHLMKNELKAPITYKSIKET